MTVPSVTPATTGSALPSWGQQLAGRFGGTTVLGRGYSRSTGQGHGKVKEHTRFQFQIGSVVLGFSSPAIVQIRGKFLLVTLQVMVFK